MGSGTEVLSTVATAVARVRSVITHRSRGQVRFRNEGRRAGGLVVSVSGVVGFVGLIVPHVCRLLLGPDHRLLLPASFLAGASFLIGADLVARTLIAPTELPVGAVTAAIGAPVFLYLLKKT